MREQITKIEFDTFLKTPKAHSYTYIIMGRSGCTGKTYLKDCLGSRGFRALELSEDIYKYISYDDKNHYIVNDLDKTVIVILNESYTRPKSITRNYPSPSMVFDNYDDLRKFLEHIRHYLQWYGCVTVADVMDYFGHTSNYLDNGFGWIDLDGIEKRQSVNDEWILTMPRTIPIQ
jgi:hypothetical protein